MLFYVHKKSRGVSLLAKLYRTKIAATYSSSFRDDIYRIYDY